MTKKQFIRAVEIVRGHLAGAVFPWNYHYLVGIELSGVIGSPSSKLVRATWIAEAYIELFSAYNDRFDRLQFLVACGLAEAPAKPKRGKA